MIFTDASTEPSTYVTALDRCYIITTALTFMPQIWMVLKRHWVWDWNCRDLGSI